MYRNALDHDIRVKLARLRTRFRSHDRGVLLGLVFSIVPIPPVAFVGLVIGLLNLRLLSRDALPPGERRLVRLSIAASVVSLVVGTALFVAVGWLVLHSVSTHFPALLERLQDFLGSLSPRSGPRAPGRGVQSI